MKQKCECQMCKQIRACQEVGCLKEDKAIEVKFPPRIAGRKQGWRLIRF
jgi:hypothetical protein